MGGGRTATIGQVKIGGMKMAGNRNADRAVYGGEAPIADTAGDPAATAHGRGGIPPTATYA